FAGRGPFLARSPAESVLELQIYLSAMAAPLLFLAALVQERQRAAAALQTAYDQLADVHASLRQSEERYREVVESQTDLACRFLTDTTLTVVNEAYCQFFGRRREDLIGHKFLELIPGPARASVLANVRSLARRPCVLTHEHEVVLPDGGVGWQHWVNYAVVGS